MHGFYYLELYFQEKEIISVSEKKGKSSGCQHPLREMNNEVEMSHIA